MKKLVIAGLSALVAGTLFTGCMRMEDNIVINNDGSCTMNGEISIEKDTLLETYSNILGGTGGGSIKKSLITAELQKQGFVPVTIDGKDYYKISSKELTGEKNSKCKNITDFYRYLSKNLGGMLSQSEDDAVSLSETSVVLRMPANANLIQNMMQDISGNGTGGTQNELLNIATNQKLLKSLKDAVVTYNVTFPTQIVETSSGAALSKDGKTVSMSFPVITDKKYEEYAYCENDIAAKGALNGVTYNSTVTVSLPDNITATLNGEPVSENKITCQKTGTYNFKLSDGDATTETLCFTVDKSAPIIKRQKDISKLKFNKFSSGKKTFLGKEYIAIYDKQGRIKSIKLDGKSVLSKAIVSIGQNKDKDSLIASYPIYSLSTDDIKEGHHSISAVDNSGYKVSGSFIVDKTKPSVEGVKNGKVYTQAVKIKFSDKNGIKAAKLNGKKVKTGVNASKEGSYKLRVTDNAGNVKTVNFKIKK